MKKQTKKVEENLDQMRFKRPIDQGGCGESDSVNFLTVSKGQNKFQVPMNKKKNTTIEDLLCEFDSINLKKSNVIKSNGQLLKPGLKVTDLNVSQVQLKIQDSDDQLYPQLKEESLISQVSKNDQIKIIIRYSTTERQFTVMRGMLVSDLKALTSKDFKININQIRLNFSKSNLVDEMHLYDYKIQNGSIVYLTLILSHACFQQNTKIMVGLNGLTKKIKDFVIGDQIISFNFQLKRLQSDIVSFVKTVQVKQIYQISLSNKTVLKCTADHKFLTSQGWKKIQTESNFQTPTLLRGDFICSVNQQKYEICQITCCKLQNSMQLYHLSVQKNHTFIAENFICHNMQLTIKTPTKSFQLDVNPSILVEQIAKNIQKETGIKIQNQKLVFAGKELDLYKTLADLNISKGASIHAIQKKNMLQLRSGLKSWMKVVTIQDQQILIYELVQNDQILAYSTLTKKPVYKRVVKVQKFKLKKNDPYHMLTFHADKSSIQFSGQIFLLQNNEYFFTKYVETNPSQIKKAKTIKNIEGEPRQCRQVLKQKVNKQEELFYRIYLEDNLPIVVNNFPVEFQVQINLKKDDKVHLQLKVLPSTLVQQLKNQIAEKLNQKIQFIHLQRGSTVLKNQDCLGVYLSPEQMCTIQLNIGEKIPSVEQIFDKKKIKVKKNQVQTILYQYGYVKKLSVQQLVKNLIQEKAEPYFCFIYGEFILKPNEHMSDLQKIQDFHNQDEILIILLKTSERMLFYRMIKAYQFTRQAMDSSGHKLNSKISSITDSNVGIQFIMNRYKDVQTNVKINNFIKKSAAFELQKTDEYNMVRQTVYAFYKMPNYMSPIVSQQNKQMSHSIIKIQNFTNFSSRNKIEGSFYWRSFVSTQVNTKDIKLPKENYTIYHIRSMTGKKIKGAQNQVVFMPFTYFFIDKIVSSNKNQEVWLTQICAPFTFKKDILLWVDDIPSNNVKYVTKILTQHPNVEYLPIISTSMAQIWMKEFAWLMNWKSIKIKVISDMSRIEGQKSVFNSKAGIDLVFMFNNKFGYTTPILIFCMDKDGALKSLQQKKINRKDRYYNVTKVQSEVYEFANIML